MDLRAYVSRYRDNRADSRLEDPSDYFDRITLLEADASAHGIDLALLQEALGVEASEVAQRELALQLLEAPADRDELSKGGATHLVRRNKAVPDSLINELALQMIGICIDGDAVISQPLYVLLRYQLNATGRPSRAPQDFQAKSIAALILASDPCIGVRRLARAIGVNASTITRWKRDPAFQHNVDELRCSKLSNVGVFVDRLTAVHTEQKQ